MDNILNGGVEGLEAAKAALIDRDEKTEAAHQAEMAKRGREKDLEAQKKYVDDKVKSTVKAKRSSLVKAYEGQVSEIEKERKAVARQRRDAKDAAVDSRIKTETADLEAETTRMKTEIKSAFKRVKVPSYCKSRYYYAMFYPHNAVDIIIFALTTVIAVAVIPNIVCSLVKIDSLLYKVLIYAAIVLFFIVVYILILLGTKGGSKGKAVLQARPVTEKIRKNQKELRRMKKEIKGSSDESGYGLEEFDEKINQLTDNISEKEKEMSDALKDFDENTALSIESEIRSDNQADIDAISKDVADLTADAEAKDAEARAAKEAVSTGYEALLGQKNMTVEKLDEMIALINNGEAETVLQAMNQINGEIKQ